MGVARAVESALVLLHWQAGHRIRAEVIKSRRAAYGQEILSTLSKGLVASHGSGSWLANPSQPDRIGIRAAA